MFHIVGFVPAPGGFSRLRLAHRVKSKLVYAGRVGTGWNGKAMAELRKQLDKIKVAKCPLDVPIVKKGTVWVKPTLQATIAYSEFTDHGMLRHPSFKGISAY